MEASKDEGRRPFGIYVHIPYCTHKCPYCDFYTFPAKRVSSTKGFVEALCREIQHAETFGWNKGREVTSIFFGGGTPSWVSPTDLEQILQALSKVFSISKDAEITLEINPEDVTGEKAIVWRKIGINRASLGVQSMDDTELFRLERQHGSEGARQAFNRLRNVGFENIGIDLMFGLEQQSLDLWMRSLETIVSWKPDHISAYGLTIEPKTRFAVEQKKGNLDVPDEETQVSMFQKTRECLAEAGLPSYEISNYAREGMQSRHNLNYWLGGEYWGIGPSAHSFQKLDGKKFRRWWNVKSLNQYISKPSFEEEILFSEVHWGERLMTGLRLAEGIELPALTKELGSPPASIRQAIESFLSTGHLQRMGERLTLSEAGVLVSNEIFRKFVL
jgi:oxygen-independent coproporphyrinogen III oxidase